MENGKRYLSVKAVAEYLSFSERTIYRLKAGREIPFVRIGKSIRFDRLEIDEVMRRLRQEPIHSELLEKN